MTRSLVIRRGDIRWLHQSLPRKKRPVVVLGREDVLPALSQIPVIPCSTQIRDLPWEVMLTPDDGVFSPCVLKPEWLRSVERSSLGARISSFPGARWPEVRDAVLNVLGLDI